MVVVNWMVLDLLITKSRGVTKKNICSNFCIKPPTFIHNRTQDGIRNSWSFLTSFFVFFFGLKDNLSFGAHNSAFTLEVMPIAREKQKSTSIEFGPTWKWWDPHPSIISDMILVGLYFTVLPSRNGTQLLYIYKVLQLKVNEENCQRPPYT